jgi:isoquinoline 1-oxidoreductase beta subunit
MKLVVNDAEVEVDDRHAKTPLLWVLRDVLGLRGTKFGCGAGFCAACTVLIDGKNVKSCQTATERAVGKAVTTVEGASGPVVNAVRDAWYRSNVVQCGYCQPGQTLAAVSLLESNPSPDDAKIDEWMTGNLCRCGTYPRIRAAIHAAAGTLASGTEPGPLVAPAEIEDRTLSDEELVDPVHPYIRIHPDGTVVAYSSQIEMGQGIHTGLATIVAEELDADFDSVRVVNAANGRGPAGDVYGNPDLGSAFQLTGASNSMKGIWVRYRLAAAQARSRLVAAAAQAWDVPAAEIEVENGVLRHPRGGEATFAELAGRAEQQPVPDGVQPKDPGDYKLTGREGRLRVDAVPKILGTTRYTIDQSLPGMLTAVVLHPPRFGATVASIEDQAALEQDGVTAVVPIEEGVAVVADNLAGAARAPGSGGGVGRLSGRAPQQR